MQKRTEGSGRGKGEVGKEVDTIQDIIYIFI